MSSSTSSTQKDAVRGPPPAIRACLFDMDGLLIDSEDKYTICTNAVLNKYGKGDLPWHIKAQMQGRPGPTAGKIFGDWAQLPISRDEYMSQIQVLQRQHFPDCQPLAGVATLLATLAQRTEPPVHLALATSSHRGNFELKSRHLAELFGVFATENRVLGDDERIGEGRGKPAPDIYALALETVNARLRRRGEEREVLPAECLVFEDSVPGVEAGRRAGMQVVWCPHPGLLEEYKGREEEVLAGLCGEYVEKADEVKRTPGKIGDGWGRLVGSLEAFPYREYGIGVKEDGKL